MTQEPESTFKDPTNNLLSFLDGLPNTSLNLSKSLSMQVWSKKTRAQEESKQGLEHQASSAGRDQVGKLKLIDLVAKVADHIATVARAETPAEFFLVLDSQVIKALLKLAQNVPIFKPKAFPEFVGTFVREVALKAQRDIIGFLSKLKDVERIMKMEID